MHAMESPVFIVILLSISLIRAEKYGAEYGESMGFTGGQGLDIENLHSEMRDGLMYLNSPFALFPRPPGSVDFLFPSLFFTFCF